MTLLKLKKLCIRLELKYLLLSTLFSNECMVTLEKKTRRDSKQETIVQLEWPLLVFSLFTTLLVAAFYAAFSKGLPIKFEFFVALALLNGAVSFFYLGEKAGAWKDALNIRKSWVGRQVLAYSLFVPLASLWLLFPQQNELGLVATIFGLLTLVSIDNIYRQLPSKKESKYHSADVLFFTVFLYVAILVSNPWMFFGALILKAYLYSTRKLMFKKEEKNIRPVFSGLRMFLGFVIPIALFFTLGFDSLNYFLLIFVVLGEVIDRIEFYLEL